MTINSAAGARFYIASDPGQPADLAAFQAIGVGQTPASTWIEVGEVEDLGEFGDESDSISFTALKDARTRKLKGARDAGSMAVQVGDDMLDTGQVAMEAAEASPLDWPFKVELNDAQTLDGDNSVHYFWGKVMSKRRNVGNVANVVRRTFNVGVNSEIFSVDPS